MKTRWFNYDSESGKGYADEGRLVDVMFSATTTTGDDFFHMLAGLWVLLNYQIRTYDHAFCDGYEDGYNDGWKRHRHKGLGWP